MKTQVTVMFVLLLGIVASLPYSIEEIDKLIALASQRNGPNDDDESYGSSSRHRYNGNRDPEENYGLAIGQRSSGNGNRNEEPYELPTGQRLNGNRNEENYSQHASTHNKNKAPAASASAPSGKVCEGRCVTQELCEMMRDPYFADDTCAFLPQDCIERACTSEEMCCKY